MHKNMTAVAGDVSINKAVDRAREKLDEAVTREQRDARARSGGQDFVHVRPYEIHYAPLVDNGTVYIIASALVEFSPQRISDSDR